MIRLKRTGKHLKAERYEPRIQTHPEGPRKPECLPELKREALSNSFWGKKEWADWAQGVANARKYPSGWLGIELTFPFITEGGESRGFAKFRVVSGFGGSIYLQRIQVEWYGME